MSFDDRENDTPTPIKKIGLKKTNLNNSAENSAERKAVFEQKVNEQVGATEKYKQQIWDLSIKYRSFIESKILPENRGPINSNIEKEVLDKLSDLALEMNADPMQQEGIGSTALCMLLMKCMLLQRDIINTLAYKLNKLEQLISK